MSSVAQEVARAMQLLLDKGRTEAKSLITPVFNVNGYGAKGDGVTDDTQALLAAVEAANKVGGIVHFPKGVYLISKPLIITAHGVRLVGVAASWENSGGSVIKATDSFSGEGIVIFQSDTDSGIRSIGMENLTVDGGAASDAHGIIIHKGYDFCLFSNVHSQYISDTKHAWYFRTNTTDVGQTITAINCIGRHRTNDATADTWRIEYIQEAVFINCKSWAGLGSTYQSGANCFYLKGCQGVTFYDCSAAFTTGSGWVNDTGAVGQGGSIRLINCLFEDTKKPFSFVSNVAQLFGNITAPPAVGSTVRQASGVSGIVTLGTDLGVYVRDVEGGSFAPGNLLANDGATVIGTITSIPDTFQNLFAVENPQVKGSSAKPFVFELNYLQQADVEIGNRTSLPADYTITVGSLVNKSVIRLPCPIAVTDNGTDNHIVFAGYKQTICSADLGTATYDLPAAFKGMRITLIKADDTANTIFTAKAASGDTIDKTGDRVVLVGTANGDRKLQSSITLYAVADGKWAVESFRGAYHLQSESTKLSFHHDMQNVMLHQTQTVTIGQQHAGFTITNKGATGSVTVNLSIATHAPGVIYRFVKLTNQTFRIAPNAADTIRGASAAGKYLELANVGDSVTLMQTDANTWDIIAVKGTPVFQP